MNKKFNLLALAAAASACGALVLTSCGKGGKTWIVKFITNDLRNSETCKYVEIPSQKIKDGKTITPPNLDQYEKDGAVRFTRNTNGSDVLEQILTGWSYADEGKTSRSKFKTTDAITEDTLLFPIYDQDKYATCCLTVELGDGAFTNDAVCNGAKIWDDNWFVKGASLKTFGEKITDLITPKSGYEFEKWTKDDADFDIASATINDDITIVAHYHSK